MQIDVKTLEFFPIENTPVFHCNLCGNPMTSGFMSEVQLGGGDTYNNVICSEKCLKEFREFPRTNEYIAENIKKIMGDRILGKRK